MTERLDVNSAHCGHLSGANRPRSILRPYTISNSLSTFRRRTSGQSMLEAALSLSLFLTLVMAAIDFGYLFSNRMTLQNAVRQAGRYAITGQCTASPGGACLQSRHDSVVQTLQNTSFGLLNSSNLGDINLSCTNQGGGCPNSAGGPSDLVTISVTYRYMFMSPVLALVFRQTGYTITVGGAFTNEPFPPAAS